jgi:low temperature requirement protein LtrA
MEATRTGSQRVSTLELFFDLVFVLTITQLTGVLYEAPTWRSLLEVVLMLALIFWMYGGYVWLTNAVAANTTKRQEVLLGGMAAYLVLALSVPGAFESTGLAFGLAYAVVILVHVGLFTRASSQAVVRGILRISSGNLAAAALVLVGGAIGGTAQYVLWAAAILVQWLTPVLQGLQGFEVEPGHFVERHGLVLLIAIGESVVAVGIGASGLDVDAGLVLVALLGLALSACLWWLYFGHGEDERAEQALVAMDPLPRARAALVAFYFCYLPMLLGIVAIAVAEHAALTDPFGELSWAKAALLGGGAAIYLVGDAAFRRTLGLGSSLSRGAVALLAVATIPLGAVSAALQIGVLVLLLSAALLARR